MKSLGRVEGYALVMGDNVDTDTIVAARFLHYTEPGKLAEGVFYNVPELRERLARVPRPVVIVAGRGFGYGSSREHAVLALLAAGVKAVVAASFHRIFYRNAINNGLLVVEYLEDPRPHLADGDRLVVDASRGVLEAPGRGLRWRLRSLPPRILSLVETGGLRGALEKMARGQRLE